MVSVLFITFVVCLFIGVPVAFSLGLASLAYFLGANMPIATFSQRFFAGIDSFTLLCIPGFTLAGNLMNQGGISDKLMDFCDKLVGHLTGGMAYANIMASMIFAGISGTALSDTVALGGIEIPMMVDLGYDKNFSVAVTAASSCMGPIIPPSLPMIMAATMTGLSVSKMFMAGIVPGILMGGGMALVSYVISKKRKYPKREHMSSFREILKSGREAIWAIIMTLIILFFVGMFMETIAAILILFPVLLQLATSVGVDSVQFGVLVVMNLVLGLCTPPVGVCLFAATNIAGNKLSDNVKALMPFLIANFIVLGLVTYVPFLTTGVANLVLGG